MSAHCRSASATRAAVPGGLGSGDRLACELEPARVVAMAAPEHAESAEERRAGPDVAGGFRKRERGVEIRPGAVELAEQIVDVRPGGVQPHAIDVRESGARGGRERLVVAHERLAIRVRRRRGLGGARGVLARERPGAGLEVVMRQQRRHLGDALGIERDQAVGGAAIQLTAARGDERRLRNVPA